MLTEKISYCIILKSRMKEGETMNSKPVKNLTKYRMLKGLSQSELSMKSGVNVATIKCYEQGTRPIETANADILIALADALDIVDVRALIGNNENENEQ